MKAFKVFFTMKKFGEVKKDTFEEQKASPFLTEKVPKKKILSKEQAEKLVNFFWKLKTDIHLKTILVEDFVFM